MEWMTVFQVAILMLLGAALITVSFKDITDNYFANKVVARQQEKEDDGDIHSSQA